MAAPGFASLRQLPDFHCRSLLHWNFDPLVMVDRQLVSAPLCRLFCQVSPTFFASFSRQP
jgi:hypothetical protein